MNDALLWNEIGNIYLRIGSPEDAIAAYTKAIELNPDSGWPYCNLGHAYFLIGEFGHALFLFRKSIQLMDTPENQAVVWNKIGNAYRALKDINNAIQAYKKADDLDIGASLSDQNAGRQPGDYADLREMIKTEEIVPDTNGLPSALPKKVTHSDPSLKSQALGDGFQPVNVGKGYGENYPPSDRPETKPPVSPKPNRITDQDITASPVGNPQNTPPLVRDSENSPLPREKSFIVIPDSSEMVENLPNEGASHNEPEQIRNSVTTIRQGEIRDGK
jgi:hypothetical protein